MITSSGWLRFSVRKALLALVLGSSLVTSQAATVLFNFDPNELLDTVPSTPAPRSTQANAQGFFNADLGVSGVSWNDSPISQPASFNTYQNWLDGLSTGEGIYTFNMWITTSDVANNPAGNSWNQGLVRDGSNGNTATGISGTASNGWTAQVTDIYNGAYGVTWTAPDSSSYLRPTAGGGPDLGSFSFTISDTNAVIGQTYRVWFGGFAMFNDQGWGTRTPTTTAPFNDLPGDTQWNGILGLTATAVPEPSSLLMLSGGVIAALALAARRRRSLA